MCPPSPANTLFLLLKISSYQMTVYLILCSKMNIFTYYYLWWWWFSHYVMSDSCDPMDYSLPGSSLHGILQAGILEWVAISFSRVSSQSRNQTLVSYIANRFFTEWATIVLRKKKHKNPNGHFGQLNIF